MKVYFFIYILIFGQFVIGQESLVRVDDVSNYSLDKINGVPHLFVDDSVYVVNDNTVKSFKSNRYELNSLIHVKDSIYKYAGGGSIYKLNSNYYLEKIVDKPKMEQSFFQSVNFIRNDTIFQFGGYGNFSHKNDLIFLDDRLNSWEFYPYNKNNKLKPPPGSPQFFSVSDSNLIVAGFYKESDTGEQNNHELIKEVWEFSFSTKKWSKKGSYDFSEKFKDKVSNYYRLGSKYYARSEFDNTLIIDFDKMEWSLYKDITSINTKFRGLTRVKNHYYVLSLYSSESIELVKIRVGELLGNEINSESIILKESNNLIILTVILFLVLTGFIGFFFVMNRNKPNIDILKKFKVNNLGTLSDDELRLIDQLISNYPRGISFKNIGGYFEKNLSFETKKLKTRKLIDTLNDKIYNKTKRVNLLKIRNKSSDKRAREVYIDT